MAASKRLHVVAFAAGPVLLAAAPAGAQATRTQVPSPKPPGQQRAPRRRWRRRQPRLAVGRWSHQRQPGGRMFCCASCAKQEGVDRLVERLNLALSVGNVYVGKHAGYCAAIRLGFRVPETWLLPHKVPPDNERFAPTAARYHRAFDLHAVGEQVGYPAYMKPFHGGGWVNVHRIGDPAELQAAYDASGRELMHLQGGVEGYDVFTRGLAIGPQTMVMHYDPTKPLHLRYQVDHDFLTPAVGHEVVTFGLSVGAFFRWEFNSFEVIVRDGVCWPIDFANATPDMAIISLHYYFPWALCALAKWCLYCVVTGRPMRLDQEIGRWYAVADDPGISWEEKLAAYRGLVDDYYEADRFAEFCDQHLSNAEECMVEYIDSPQFDAHLVETIRRAFPPHEHEQFIAHYRGLVGAWANDQQSAAGQA